MAGLIDGEGCLDFAVVRPRNYKYRDGGYLVPRLRVTLVESCDFLLENMVNNFGGRLEYRELSKKNPMWQNAVTWVIQGRKILGVLNNIKSHLILKKNQANFLCMYIEKFSCKRFEELDVGRKFRKEVQDELKAMKRHPHRLSDPARFYREAIVETSVS